eukprot:11848913-Alexandrium_andersonii.AAC.1
METGDSQEPPVGMLSLPGSFPQLGAPSLVESDPRRGPLGRRRARMCRLSRVGVGASSQFWPGVFVGPRLVERAVGRWASPCLRHPARSTPLDEARAGSAGGCQASRARGCGLALPFRQ